MNVIPLRGAQSRADEAVAAKIIEGLGVEAELHLLELAQGVADMASEHGFSESRKSSSCRASRGSSRLLSTPLQSAYNVGLRIDLWGRATVDYELRMVSLQAELDAFTSLRDDERSEADAKLATLQVQLDAAMAEIAKLKAVIFGRVGTPPTH